MNVVTTGRRRIRAAGLSLDPPFGVDPGRPHGSPGRPPDAQRRAEARPSGRRAKRTDRVHGTQQSRRVRNPGGKQFEFRVTDGTTTYPVIYRGLAPDTFTDGVDVVVEGRLGHDGTFHATTLLAKCASRYENAPPGMGQPGAHPASVPKTQQS